MEQLVLSSMQSTHPDGNAPGCNDETINHVSHELRTPATAVKMYINMLLDGYAGSLTASQRKFLSQANSSNEQQISVIDRLIDSMRPKR